jgi:hypothetical protein
VRRIDLLKTTTGGSSDGPVEYAHYYSGFGLTPVVAIDLEKAAMVR